MRPTDFDAIIGRNTVLEGTLKSSGSVRVDGEMLGNITTDGEVIIGQEAKTEGDIKSSNIEISGSVEGNIDSDGCLKIYETGSLFGNIEVKSFVIEEGGVFEGMCHINTSGMKRPSDSKPKEPTTKKDHKNQKECSRSEEQSQPTKSRIIKYI